MAGVGSAATKGGPGEAGQVVQMWPLSRFRPYDRNPRKNDHAVERVAAAIREFGFKVPVLARSSGELVDGHLRLKAATFLGLETIPVLLADDLTDAQVRAFRISVNRMAELAEWDTDLLAAELDALAELDVPAELAGWTGAELEELDVPVAAPEVLADPEEVPEVKPVVTTRPGDLWLLGGHRLLCGDSTKAEDVARVMNGGGADMLLTDPPYGVSYVGRTKDALKIQNDDLGDGPLTEFVCHVFNNAQASCRAGAYWYATVPPGPLHIIFADDWKRRGVLRQIMIWAKDVLVLGHNEYHYQHEPILFGWIPGDRHKNSDRTRTSLWKYDRPKASREHPTMKPVALWAQAVADGSRPGETVLDPFLGSGTTLIAAEQLGRRCYGLELDPGYCDVIVRRWEGVTGKQATLEATGETFAAVADKRAEETP